MRWFGEPMRPTSPTGAPRRWSRTLAGLPPALVTTAGPRSDPRPGPRLCRRAGAGGRAGELPRGGRATSTASSTCGRRSRPRRPTSPTTSPCSRRSSRRRRRGMSKDLPYRPAAGIMLLNAEGKVFVGQRLDSTLEAWQMPQGGIDKGEDPQAAALRELYEETGIPRISSRSSRQAPEPLDYDLPRRAGRQAVEGQVSRPAPALVPDALPRHRRRRRDRDAASRVPQLEMGRAERIARHDRAVQARRSTRMCYAPSQIISPRIRSRMKHARVLLLSLRVRRDGGGCADRDDELAGAARARNPDHLAGAAARRTSRPRTSSSRSRRC